MCAGVVPQLYVAFASDLTSLSLFPHMQNGDNINTYLIGFRKAGSVGRMGMRAHFSTKDTNSVELGSGEGTGERRPLEGLQETQPECPGLPSSLWQKAHHLSRGTLCHHGLGSASPEASEVFFRDVRGCWSSRACQIAVLGA